MNFIENLKIKSAFKKHIVPNRVQNVELCISFKKEAYMSKLWQRRSQKFLDKLVNGWKTCICKGVKKY